MGGGGGWGLPEEGDLRILAREDMVFRGEGGGQSSSTVNKGEEYRTSTANHNTYK